MVTSAFHPPEEVKKKKIVRKTKKVRFKKNPSRKQKTADNLSTEKPPKKKKKKTTGRTAASKLKRDSHPDKSNSETGNDKLNKEDQSQIPADDQKKEESAIPAKPAKFKKKKAHSSSTDTSDEEYKAMVAAGIIRKPEKKKSLQQTEEFKPKTEQELLDFFLARHNADKLLVSKPQQKVVETPDKPLSKREMFRQHFDAKAKEKEGEVKEITASDYFPLALAAEEIQKAKAKKGGKAKRKKVKKQKKGNKSKQLTSQKGGENKVLPPKARKKKSTASKKKKKSKTKKLLEAEDPLDEVLHDVTIVVDQPQQTPKKKRKKIKKKRKKKTKGKNQELPSHLQKLIDKISGEVEISAGFEDHDVGVSGNVADDGGKLFVQDEKSSSELAKASETVEDTVKSKDIQKKKEIRFKTKRTGKNQPKKTKIARKPVVKLPSNKLSRYPWNSSTDDDVKKFERIWVEVTGPNLQVEEFSADLNSRLMRAPPGSNLSLTQLFSAEEMKGVTRVIDHVEASKDETNFLALEQMGRIQTMIDFYITPLEIFQDKSKHGQKQPVDSSRKSSRRAWNSRSPSPMNNIRQKSPQKAEHRMNPPRRQQLLSQRSRAHTRLFKVKRKKHSNSQEKEYQDAATLEADTQIENLEGLSKVRITSEEGEEGSPTGDSPAIVSTDEKAHDSTGKHVTFQSRIDFDGQLIQEEELRQGAKAIQQKRLQGLDEELDYDMLRDLQVRLKEGIRIILTKGTSDDIQREIEALRKELVRRKEVDPPEILVGKPRVYDKSMVRYELPMDITILEGLTPLQYLEEYSFISEPLKNLHAKVFRRHCDLQPTGNFSLADLTVAMTEIMGNCWCPDDSEVILKILGLSVQKAGPRTEVLPESPATSGVGGETAEGAASSESLKESSPSQLLALDKDMGSKRAPSKRQSTLGSNFHHRSLSSSPPGSSTGFPNASVPRLIDLLNASRERRLKVQNLAEVKRKEITPDVMALRSSRSYPPVPVTSLDLNQFHAVAALAERLFCTKYAKIGKNEVKNKEYVEMADFERLEQKLSYITVSDELHDLLFLIKNS